MSKKSINKFFKNRLFKNFSYLSILQLVNVIIPLTIYPYLIITLGSDLYGKIIYATSLNAYFLVLVNYGFDISVVKSLAENKDKKAVLFELFKNTLWSKFFLFIVSFLLLILAMFFIPFIEENKILCLVSTIITLGELFFPRWYFLAIEELKYSTFTVVISKILSLILIYIYVKDKGDYLLVPIFLGVSTIVGSIYAMRYALSTLHEKQKMVRSYKPNYIEISRLIKEGFSFFLSRGFVVVREKAGILIIGELFGFREVSVFDLIQKIIKVLTIPIDMINTVIFPRVARTKNLKHVKKGGAIALVFSLLCYFIILFFPFNLIDFIRNNDMFYTAINLLYIFGFGLILQVFVYFFGNTTLVVFGFNKEFNYTVIFGGIIYLLCLSYGFIGEISIMWIGYCTLISYVSIIISRLYFINKYKLWK